MSKGKPKVTFGEIEATNYLEMIGYDFGTNTDLEKLDDALDVVFKKAKGYSVKATGVKIREGGSAENNLGKLQELLQEVLSPENFKSAGDIIAQLRQAETKPKEARNLESIVGLLSKLLQLILLIKPSPDLLAELAQRIQQVKDFFFH